MSAEYVVPDEWVVLAQIIYDGGEIAGAMRRALAAVLPQAIAAERERCARVLDAWGHYIAASTIRGDAT